MIIKEIKTERLYLRAFKDTDGTDLHDYLSNSYVKKMLDFDGCTREECDVIVMERAKGDSYFAITLNERVIGHVELHETKHQGIFEIGYVFNPDFYGKGYAYEAIKAILLYAKTINIKNIVASTSPENKPSIHLLEKVGFIEYEGLNLSDYSNQNDMQFKIYL